jgi:hypothetical protein
MVLAQVLIPIAIVVGLTAALVSRAAATGSAGRERGSSSSALIELAAALGAAGLLGTVVVAAFMGGYAGSLERAGWAGGSFLAGFAAVGLAGVLAFLLDDAEARASAMGPLTAVAFGLGAAAGLYGLASNVAGEGPWAAAALVAPGVGGAGLAAMVVALGAAGTVPRAVLAAWSGLAVVAIASAGLLAGGEGAGISVDGAWAVFPLVVLACALVGAAVGLLPGTVAATGGRAAAGAIGAWPAAVAGGVAATGSAVVLLPGGEWWAAGAAIVGSVTGLILAHGGVIRGTSFDRPAARAGTFVAAAIGLAVAWGLGRELAAQGFDVAAGGFFGLSVAAAAALGPAIVRASIFPASPVAAVVAETVDVTAWERPGETGAVVEARASEVAERPRPANGTVTVGILAMAAVAVALGVAVQARHELLAVAGEDPTRYAATLQELGLVPPGIAERYALANAVRAHREALDELRVTVASEKDFGANDARLLLGASQEQRDVFVAAKLDAGALIPAETAVIEGASRPLPGVLPPGLATAGGVAGLLLGLAAVVAAGALAGRRGGPVAGIAVAGGALALLLAVGPAIRFFGPGEADSYSFALLLALVAGPAAAATVSREDRAVVAGTLGLGLAALALALVPGLLI